MNGYRQAQEGIPKEKSRENCSCRESMQMGNFRYLYWETGLYSVMCDNSMAKHDQNAGTQAEGKEVFGHGILL